MTPAQLEDLRAAWPGTWTASTTEAGVYLLDSPPREWLVYAYINPQGQFVVGAERHRDIFGANGAKARDAVKSLTEKVARAAAPVDRLRAALPAVAVPGPMENELTKAKFRREERDSELPEPMDPHARAFYLERARQFPGRSGD